MKEIELFENIDRSMGFGEQGMNRTIYWAYKNSLEAGKDLIDFDELIWDDDIGPILEICKSVGITKFTISSSFSSLIDVLNEFGNRGCHIACLTKVKARYTDRQTGERASIPALLIKISSPGEAL
ncbi:DUF7698 family protein [Eubacterium sp.]|uniref:DUF7698 family protein n=1 Tax=Eubacterium sp. TaxID=142586 RepID=UPI002FC89D90